MNIQYNSTETQLPNRAMSNLTAISFGTSVYPSNRKHSEHVAKTGNPNEVGEIPVTS